jgi:hypothetical protein
VPRKGVQRRAVVTPAVKENLSATPHSQPCGPRLTPP